MVWLIFVVQLIIQQLILSNMDEYLLSSSPQKFMMAQHYHSSLDAPNIDNVEAKLYATRQKNHQIAMMYFKNKYGSTAVYEQFARTHNLGQVKEVHRNNESLQRHLERKAREIEESENMKFKQRKGENEIRIDEQQTKVERTKKSRESKNPWTQPRQSQKKQKNVRFQSGEDQVIQSAQNKKQESQFIGEFKKYLVSKQKQPKVAFEATNKSTFTNKSLSVSKLDKSQKFQTKKQKSYEEELVKKIFIDLTGSVKTSSKVEKYDLVQYLVLNKKILKVLGITEEELNSKLLVEHETKEDTTINYHELLFFILKTVGKQSQINHIKQDIRDKNVPEGCMLSQSLINYFEEVFNKIDKHCDLIIKRTAFISSLANDPTVRNQLNLPAVYEGELDKQVSLRRIFERIEMQALIGSEEQKKVRDFITWNQFLEYFRSGFHDRSKYDLMILVDSLRSQEKFGLQIPDLVSEIIGKSFKKIDKGTQYFNIYEVLQEISKNPDYEHEKFTLVRSGSEDSAAFSSETFEDVLTRIKEKGQQFMTIKEFLQYFSSRGKPIEEFELSQSTQMKKSYGGVKVKFAEQEHLKKGYEPDGYDSDPQMYSSNLNLKSSAKKNQKQKGPASKSFLALDTSQINIDRKNFKVTVPVPFAFEERQKMKQKKVVQSRVEAEHSKPFKAKPIPEKVRDENLYERMLEEDQKRIEERKKNSMIMTLAAERPFSFENRKVQKKTKRQREEFQFKAKPIPWFCSVDLLRKKKEAEIERNQKIAKQAQESLAKAKLPPRMERDYQQKLAKKAEIVEQINEQSRESQLKVYRKPPNFSKIHKEFSEAMERKRKENKVTRPQEFSLSKPNPRPQSAAHNQTVSVNEFSESLMNKFGKGDYKKNLETKELASSTLKYTQQAEKRRKEMEEKRVKEIKKKKQEQERQKIDEELKKKVVQLAKNKQNKEKELLQRRKEQMAEQKKNFDNWKKQRIQKGRQQPLLVERPLKRDEKIQKMKKLYMISQTLKQNGIKGKEHDVYFKREELILLQDYEALKDKI